ncbi:MAG: N-formylglutamate amidohydrolase [Rhodospirillum sp.]|nr:N-formylglutamate amidohydrolase [Rhodospirillum sp.]MCF8489919.1 N-formylglutamate amidohydrolase [Rhodospirillum sp.]MCF8502529.1 N-formylglutamate amidohydrolase [Rhodospirillum sp.]
MALAMGQRMDAERIPGAVEIVNPLGRSSLLLVCEHASHHIPPEFGSLGLSEEALTSHIAWDPGARDLAFALAENLDATLVAARVSRLVYDVNRPPDSDSAIPEVSEAWRIPGNENLSPTERAERVDRIYRPFRDGLAETLDQRTHDRRPVALVTIHSFTPVYNGVARQVQVGVLHDSDTRLADGFLARMGDGRFDLRRNEPYAPADGVTHTLREHGIARGLPNMMIEIRNDLLANSSDRSTMAAWLALGLRSTLSTFTAEAWGTADTWGGAHA